MRKTYFAMLILSFLMFLAGRMENNDMFKGEPLQYFIITILSAKDK
jgi:hypothetical protein